MHSEVHIAFSETALANIMLMHSRFAPRPAIYLALDDRVTVGPIGTTSLEERRRWLLGHTLSGDESEPLNINEIERSWRNVLGLNGELIVWWSRRSIAEYTGFLQ